MSLGGQEITRLFSECSISMPTGVSNPAPSESDEISIDTVSSTLTSRQALASFFQNLTLASKKIIDDIVCTLESLPEEHYCDLNALFSPAFENEKLLRSIFLIAKRQQMDIPDPCIGLVKLFDLTANCTRSQKPQDESSYHLASSRHSWHLPSHRLIPLTQAQRRPHGFPTFVKDIAQFRLHLDIFSDGSISSIKNWSNILIAGGCVLACVSAFPNLSTQKDLNKLFHSDAYINADIDIFLYGLTAEQAQVRMEEIYQEIDTSSRWDVICVRKRNTISIHTTWPKRTIQIVLCLYQSRAEILAGFDVDASCFGYDGEHVYTTPRGLAAAIRQMNTIDLLRCSPSYEFRLVKYYSRHFEIFAPELNRSNIKYDHMLRNRHRIDWPRRLLFLLTAELVIQQPLYFPYLSWPPTGYSRRVEPDSHTRDDPHEPILESNYDSVYFKIHYNRGNDAAKIERDIKHLDAQMNSDFNMQNEERRLHRHAVFCGTMQECIGDFCKDCPVPITEEEKVLVASEKNFIRGPVLFIEDDPGRQYVGSFNPIDSKNWYLEAYSDLN